MYRHGMKTRKIFTFREKKLELVGFCTLSVIWGSKYVLEKYNVSETGPAIEVNSS
jgi:hypothetical protein